MTGMAFQFFIIFQFYHGDFHGTLDSRLNTIVRLYFELAQAQYSNSCLNAGRKLALTFGSARGDTGADTKESFVFSGGEIAGCVDFARAVVHEV